MNAFSSIHNSNISTTSVSALENSSKQLKQNDTPDSPLQVSQGYGRDPLDTDRDSAQLSMKRKRKIMINFERCSLYADVLREILGRQQVCKEWLAHLRSTTSPELEYLVNDIYALGRCVIESEKTDDIEASSDRIHLDAATLFQMSLECEPRKRDSHATQSSTTSSSSSSLTTTAVDYSKSVSLPSRKESTSTITSAPALSPPTKIGSKRNKEWGTARRQDRLSKMFGGSGDGVHGFTGRDMGLAERWAAQLQEGLGGASTLTHRERERRGLVPGHLPGVGGPKLSLAAKKLIMFAGGKDR
jgi:hypothetical protein